jgi:hypothetical protein
MAIAARTLCAALALGLLSCSPAGEFDKGLRSTNLERVGDFRTLMTKHGIPHRNTAPENGMEGFFYRSADEPRIDLLREKLDRQTSVKYEEPEARAYLQRLLTEMSHDFIVTDKSDGTWIKWFPESENQQNEIEMKVVEYIFELKAEQAAGDCEPSSVSSNHTLLSDARQEPRAAKCKR